MRPDYLWTISTPEEAWDRVNDRVVNILLSCEILAKAEGKDAGWESKLGDVKLELVGYLYVLTTLMKADHPDVSAKIQEILDLVVPADMTDPDVRRNISTKHEEVNPYSLTNQRRSRAANRI